MDEELLASSAGETFTVIGGGLTEQPLTVETVERGKVKFNLVKEWEKTRAANQEYLFSNIRLVDISVTNLFTRETVTFSNVKVTYEEDSKENQNPDNADDKYMDIGKAYCDSTVSKHVLALFALLARQAISFHRLHVCGTRHSHGSHWLGVCRFPLGSNGE